MSFVGGVVRFVSTPQQLVFTAPPGAIMAAALAAVVYRPAVDFWDQDALQIAVDDLGGSGAGGPKSAAAVLHIAVTPVNDAPRVAAAPSSASITEVCCEAADLPAGD